MIHGRDARATTDPVAITTPRGLPARGPRPAPGTDYWLRRPTGRDEKRVGQKQRRGDEKQHVENQSENDRTRRRGSSALLQFILRTLLCRHWKQTRHRTGQAGKVALAFDHRRRQGYLNVG